MPWGALVVAFAWVGPQAGPRVQWEAPPQCPTAAAVDERIDRVLSPDASVHGEPPRARVQSREGGGFSLQFEVDRVDGTVAHRTLDADDCELLADAAALLTAVAIDPVTSAAHAFEISAAPGPPAPAPAPAPAPRVDPVEPDDPAATPVTPTRPPSKRKVRGLLRLQGAGGFGALPSFGGGVGVVAGLLVPWARLEIGGHYWFDRNAEYSDDPGVGGDLRLWAVGGRVCVEPSVRRLSVPVCVGGEGGQTRGQGTGVDTPEVDRRAWAGLTFGPAVTWAPIPNVALYGGVDVLVPILRTEYAIGDRGVLFRTLPAGLRLVGGIEVRFP